MSDDEPRDDEELARLAEDLASDLDDLRRELERRGPPDPPEGPLGLPRPPTPREALEFADEVAIPAIITILEANIKLLEALQRAIRLAEAERTTRERTKEARDRAGDLGEATLERLGVALEDLTDAIEGDTLPEDETARAILEDARDLREEIERRVGDARRNADRARDSERRRRRGRRRGSEIEVRDARDRRRDGDRRNGHEAASDADENPGRDDRDGTDAESEDGSVDVEAELRSLKREYGHEDREHEGDGSGDDRGADTTGNDGEHDPEDESRSDDGDGADGAGG